jgi:hypothetical protein
VSWRMSNRGIAYSMLKTAFTVHWIGFSSSNIAITKLSRPISILPIYSTLQANMSVQPKNLNNTYVAPSHPYLKPVLICGVIMALSARREVISPGSPLYDYVLSRSGTALKVAIWIQNGLFYFLFGAHAIETAMFTKRLNTHGVSVMSLAWWKWMATCFVGGKFVFEHFDRLVGKTA